MNKFVKSAEPKLKTKDDLWADDLFGRRQEAEQLEAYIQSVYEVSRGQENANAFTISVNAPYGVGKTFFLKRLEEHLSHSHPVAYVDAWKDDLADEPLTALVATLSEALKVYEQKDADSSIRSVVAKSFEKVKQSAGKIAVIAGKEALRRGASLLVSEAFQVALSGIMKASSEAQAERLEDQAVAFGEAVTSAIESEYKGVAPGNLMRDRIEAFEQGQKAIQDLKDSLKVLVESLIPEKAEDSEAAYTKPPIIIIIDELDRCRPTYAVKLLEEIKHLFDVPGLVFILGMNDEQLSKSLAGAYGPEFDGKAYLRRFINREYTLSMPDLEPLLQMLLVRAGISEDKFSVHNLAGRGSAVGSAQSLAAIIAAYMRLWGLTARDAFRVVDLLQTCVFIADTLMLITPLIVVEILEKVSGKGVSEVNRENINMFNISVQGAYNRKQDIVSALDLYFNFKSVFNFTDAEFTEGIDSGNYYVRLLYDNGYIRSYVNGIGDPRNYRNLVEAVGRFKTPHIG